MSAFRQARDAAIHADSSDLEHHLIEFVREVKRNPLCQRILSALPAYDASAWWKHQTDQTSHSGRLAALIFPESPDDKLVVLWDLVSSMGSDSSDLLDFRGFGQLMGAYKASEAAAKSISLVIRPFAEAMTGRLREEAAMASPNLRELAGVPLAAIPSENETRIFLSHRTADKPLVQPYFDLLSELGHKPWLDAHDMPAGTMLHRGITEGIDTSCAIVFFVTKNFEDERWLAREVDQAVHRKIEVGDKFAIITLVFDGGEVPRPLRDYVWANVKNEVDAIRAIVRALPLELGPPRWRERIYKKKDR
nr:toll/interleukin-1 receptor domain-containing protein [Pyxidicoccus fallax]